jgi:pyruvate,water dikinase
VPAFGRASPAGSVVSGSAAFMSAAGNHRGKVPVMSKISAILDYFGKKRRAKAARGEDESRLFVAYYQAFRRLLDHNHQVLRTMGDMQEKAQGGYLFDRAYIRSSCRDLLSGIEHIIGELNTLADNRYADLMIPFQRCMGEIQTRIDPKIEIPEGPFVRRLEAVGRDDLPAVGGKLSPLGDIAKDPSLSVPPGFVITTTAFMAFMAHNRIGEFVESALHNLDIRDYEALQQVTEEIQKKVFSGEIPPQVETAVVEGMKSLTQAAGRQELRMAVRSSALQEDIRASFAGQYRSELNVPPEGLLSAYKGILVSLFSPRAVFYFKDKAFDIANMAMAVGVMAMVDARFSGVLFSRDPAGEGRDRVLVNAVRGLGPYAVDGTEPADVYTVDYGSTTEVRVQEIGGQRRKLVCAADQGLAEEVLTEDSAGVPCLSDAQIRDLARIGRRLESKFGRPQDVEWAIDDTGQVFVLQSRPLKISADKGLKPERKRRIEGYPVRIDGGTVVCRGAASGRVRVLRDIGAAGAFSEGEVLVIRHSHPEFAVLLKKAAAVVSDVGTVLGHLATVAREYRIPAIFNTEKATRELEDGLLVTVDADYAMVYEGRVEEILHRSEPPETEAEAPVVRSLREILTFVTPLNLTDPRSAHFSPASCKTLHDITRFSHEAALRTMFSLARESWFTETSARQLKADLPLQWWVIDLGGGIVEGSRGKTVNVTDLKSVPMRALWKGMIALPWKGPPPVDTKGFLSTMMNAMTNPDTEPAVDHGLADRNIILVAEDFVNVSTRLGFHFSTVESFIGESENQNYISFVFTGGGADDGRRGRRARLIGKLLERFDFRVEIKGDTVFARVVGHSRTLTENRLQVLGHVIVHTRQMDMVMYNEQMIDFYYRDMAAEIESHIAGESA